MIDGKKQTTYTWDAHSPQDCVKDLVTLCKDLRVGLQARFTNIVPTSVKKLCNVFDFEKIAKHMCNYKVKDGRLVIEHDTRIQWETSSNNELHKFFKHVCALPHVQALADSNHDLDLLPTDSNAVLKRFKTTLQKFFGWRWATALKSYSLIVTVNL
jgi:hypothetical protein